MRQFPENCIAKKMSSRMGKMNTQWKSQHFSASFKAFLQRKIGKSSKDLAEVMLHCVVIQSVFDLATEKLAHLLAHFLALLTFLLALHCSLWTRALLRPIICTLAPKLVGQWKMFVQFSKSPDSWITEHWNSVFTILNLYHDRASPYPIKKSGLTNDQWW